MKKNKRYILFGFALIAAGLNILFSGGGFMHYSYISSGGGLIIALIGCFFLLFSIKRDEKKYYDTNVKCKSCGALLYSYELKNQRCPKCNGEVDNLKGFFKRNPQFKN